MSNDLGKKFGNESIGLYRDYGLAILKYKSVRLADEMRKELFPFCKNSNMFSLLVIIVSNSLIKYNIAAKS